MPHLANLADNVKQYSPPVNETLQVPQNTKHSIITYPTYQPQTHRYITSPDARELETDDQPPTTDNLPAPPPTIAHLIDALTTNDHHINALIQALSNDWSGYNAKGMKVTMRQLLQSAWGELKESDSLQAFQQAIITSLPPTTTTVTQYYTHLTFAICMDITVWQHC